MFQRLDKRLRLTLSVTAIGLTLGLFWYYITRHHIGQQLQQVPWQTLLLIGLLYLAMTAVVAQVNQLSLRMVRKRLPTSENFLLAAYSSVINFFGPLQSGPGARALYVKRRLAISLKQYLALSLWYYACFAVASGCWFVAGWLPWWAVLASVALGITALWQFSGVFRRRLKLHAEAPGLLRGVGVMVIVQLIIVSVIYRAELHGIGSTISWRQLMAYTGAANFSLFVSLTPGALGFREAFLLLTRRVTDLDANTIVAANVLDRAIYLVFLAVLFGLILVFHGQQKFKAKPSATTPAKDPSAPAG